MVCDILVLGELFSEVSELAAEDGQLIPYLVGGDVVFAQMFGTVRGNAVKLFGALDSGGGITHLFEIRECRINHAGAGRIDSAGMFFDSLDDFITIAGVFPPPQ